MHIDNDERLKDFMTRAILSSAKYALDGEKPIEEFKNEIMDEFERLLKEIIKPQ